ncbi:hypothetical protein [Candidatus Nanohalobium constans]|uniref:Uncharacterized protein n=1 Tax=Candidatus Nanohalobium constans TaxID=2565781 RepID=A0A5Q0UIJ4_9ARCH|nr:hypothetical protein [Candidatus Nanohalobium constans]QGA80950.1 hypothetical protein LC1Nh_1079 [Candidatus Nanohalobium constans]
MEERIPSPAGISLIGAATVVILYWVHLVALGTGIGETGVEITLFISAFLAQYIPLAALKSDLQEV